jgi:hypothetical protein
MSRMSREVEVLTSMKQYGTSNIWTGTVKGVTYDMWLSTTPTGKVWSVYKTSKKVSQVGKGDRTHVGTYSTWPVAMRAIIADRPVSRSFNTWATAREGNAR